MPTKWNNPALLAKDVSAKTVYEAFKHFDELFETLDFGDELPYAMLPILWRAVKNEATKVERPTPRAADGWRPVPGVPELEISTSPSTRDISIRRRR